MRFPAVNNDVGSMLAFLMGMLKPKTIFEMGSGYGHSAFWYFVGASSSLEKVVLTEKREDLKEVFEELPWPVNWKRKMDYHQGDAFEKLSAQDGLFDFFLVDGVKGDYLSFLQAALPKLSPKGVIAIDNSYWRGSFLRKQVRERKASAAKVYELHRWIEAQRDYQAVFIPYVDGLTLIRRRD